MKQTLPLLLWRRLLDRLQPPARSVWCACRVLRVTQEQGGWFLSLGPSKHTPQVAANAVCSRSFRVQATVASSTGRNKSTGKLVCQMCGQARRSGSTAHCSLTAHSRGSD